MATNFPAGLDDFTNYVDGTTIMEAATLNDMQWGIEAVQAKVGIDSSAVPASHDYKLAHQGIVQVVNTQTGAKSSGSTTIPRDDTIPQKTQGNEYMTLAITPTDAANKLKIEVVVNGACSLNYDIIAALFQDATSNALAVGSSMNVASEGQNNIKFTHYMTAGTVIATTFKVRVGPASASMFTFNGRSNGRLFGGKFASSITITEIKV